LDSQVLPLISSFFFSLFVALICIQSKLDTYTDNIFKILKLFIHFLNNILHYLVNLFICFEMNSHKDG
jgi:hypothetical protein